ncbi:MAG: GIY-YIG nuclease family protein [Acetobacteraceae bacterium]
MSDEDVQQLRKLIIKEIKRLASLSGGQAPGRRLFTWETGRSESKWAGVIWARWSEALAEAGFGPNQLQKKLDRDSILERLSDACRHFGHFPTVAEQKMFRRRDVRFPSKGAIASHFGSQQGAIAAVRLWTVSNPDAADVLDLLPSPPPVQPILPRRLLPKGHVYLLSWGEFCKIGRSDTLEKRIKEIGIALPDKAVLLHSIETDDPPGIEAYWHRRFADRRANGEWFRLTPDDVAAFKRRRFQ